MRRFFVPIILVAALVAASILAMKADNASDPGHAAPSQSGAVAITTPLLSVRRAPEWLRRPTADRMLGRQIQNVLTNSAMPASRCISVDRDGVEVARNSAGALFTPGSLQRLITAAAATEALAPDSVYRTEAVVRADVEVTDAGVLDGNIWLVGGGDPVLATADYVDRFSPKHPFTDLATLADTVAGQLADDGVTSISGGVMGDESKYTPAERSYVGEETPAGVVWTRKDNAGNRVGPLSALLVNNGFTAWPDTVDPAKNTRSTNPAIEAAALFARLLTERGIKIGGRAGDSVAPQGADRRALGGIESPPFIDILGLSLSPGGATTAEMILKEIGVRSGVTALRVNAILFGETILLERAGLPVAGTAIADGSGLSALNQTTCDLLVATLESRSESSPLLGVIPDAGVGPLAGCISDSKGDLRLLATAQADTTGVAGRYIAPNGDQVSFAMIANGPELGATLGQCNDLQIAMVNAVAGHPYGPSLDDLAPPPAGSG